MSYSIPRIAPLTACLAVTALAVAACDVHVETGSGSDSYDGPTVTESFDIDEFDHLVVDDTWTVFVTVGPEAGLDIEVAEDLLDEVQVDQSGDRLTISLDGPRWFSSHRGTREAHLTTPSLTELDVGGAASVQIVGLTGDELDVDLSGAVEVDLGEVELQRLNVGLEGASSIAGYGTADIVKVNVAGASLVDFGSMTVDVADDASVSLKTTGLSSID